MTDPSSVEFGNAKVIQQFGNMEGPSFRLCRQLPGCPVLGRMLEVCQTDTFGIGSGR